MARTVILMLGLVGLGLWATSCSDAPAPEATSLSPSGQMETTGQVDIAVRWPEREAETRLVPLDADSVQVRALDAETGEDLGNSPLVLVRPPAAGDMSMGRIVQLPLRQVRFVVTAHPDVGAAETPLASGEGAVEIHHGLNSPLRITMASEVDLIGIAPTSPVVYRGFTDTVAATAKNANGEIVLVSRSWSWSSSDPAIATVDASGVVTGIADGTVTLTATDTDSGKSGAVSAEVKPPAWMDSAWPMYGHDVRHSGLSPYVIPKDLVYTSGLAQWQWTDPIHATGQSYVLDSEGNSYFTLLPYGSSNALGGSVFSITPGGLFRWQYTQFTEGYGMRTCPAISAAGTIVAGCTNGCVYGMNQAGEWLWTFRTGASVQGDPTIGPDGTIYIGSDDGNLYALNPDGTEKWDYTVGSPVRTCPAIAEDGTIYFGAENGHYYALRRGGSLLWSVDHGFPVHNPSLGPDGTLYYSCDDQYLYARAPDGSVKWTYDLNGAMIHAPSIGPDGAIFCCATNGQILYVLEADGALRWQYDTAFRGWNNYLTDGKPLIDSMGKVALPVGLQIMVLDREGFHRWDTGGVFWREQCPSLGADGVLLYGGGPYYNSAIWGIPE